MRYLKFNNFESYIDSVEGNQNALIPIARAKEFITDIIKPSKRVIIEDSYFDNEGNKINEFDILKVAHFTDSNGKQHFMLKIVGLRYHKKSGTLMWYAFHQFPDGDRDGYFLFSIYPNYKLSDSLIVRV